MSEIQISADNVGHTNNEDDDIYDEIDCQLNYEDVIDFLEEEMPTKEQMEQWKKDNQEKGGGRWANQKQ